LHDYNKGNVIPVPPGIAMDIELSHYSVE